MHRSFIQSAINDNVGKIILYGDVLSEHPKDWWTNEPIEMECITPEDFKKAMAEVEGCSKIELHIHSYGGDATVGILLRNLLKASGKYIIGVVDGICASAAFTILSGCNEVRVYKGSILMCHEVKSLLWGYYGNDDLKKIENGNTAYNNSAAEYYAEKSGMSKTQCLNLMKKETWMTGPEAIEYGFADKLIETGEETEPPVELINKSKIRINGAEHNIEGLNIPDVFVTHIKNNGKTGGKEMSEITEETLIEKVSGAVANALAGVFKPSNSSKESEEGQEPEQKTEEQQEGEGQNEQAQEGGQEVNAEEIVNSAKKEERERIQGILKISSGIDSELVQEALFGETACDAKELALRSMEKEKQNKAKALEKLNKDNTDSRANSIMQEPGTQTSGKDIESERKNAVEKMRAKIKEG